jgi:hypothetical protein
MQKLISGCFIGMIAIAAINPTVNAQTAGEYIDSSSPQAIEKISGNIITFKDVKGDSRNYYVPTWMIDQYSLKVGTSMNLYNRNVIQGIYRGSYIDVVSQGLPANMESFAIHDTRKNCTLAESPASEGLGSGKRVWYKSECCPSTIPVVGAMWFYQRRAIVAIEPTERTVIPTAFVPTPVQQPIEQPPVPALW